MIFNLSIYSLQRLVGICVKSKLIVENCFLRRQWSKWENSVCWVCVGVVSFRERDCGGRDLRGLSASLELARVVCEREGTGQRLTDGLSATRTAGRWLWQFGQGRNFGSLRQSSEKMLQEASNDIPLSGPEQTLSLKMHRRWGGGGEGGATGEWARERDCNPSTYSLRSHASESPGDEPSPQAGRQEVQWLSAGPRFQICRSPYV